jgi:hypothetical protein
MATPRICTVDGCGNIGELKGLCRSHYGRWKRHGDPLAGRASPLSNPPPICSIDGCSRPTYAKALCDPHYKRLLRHGDPLAGGTANGEAMQYIKDHMWDDCPKWPYGTTTAGYAILAGLPGTSLVHRYVCQAVHGPSPSPAHQAAHNCGKGHEGCFGARCVEWKTVAENEKDKKLHGRVARGEGHPLSRLVADDIRKIRQMANAHSSAQIAEMFAVTRAHVNSIIARRAWRWLD